MKIDEIDKRIISWMQGDLPLVARPFAVVADELGIEEDEVIRRVAAMADSGVMRRFGATLRHQKSGFAANVMVAWRVAEKDIDRVGNALAAYRQVSHCYHRPANDLFPYNVYSMVHGKSREECREVVAQMAAEVEQDDYQLLFSEQELKKTSMSYF